jgi:hypothetical protein
MKQDKKSKVILKTTRKTFNRGYREFIVSIDEKGYYFAHEIGGMDQISKVLGLTVDNGATYIAHRLNPTVFRSNQYGRFAKVKPLKTKFAALRLIINQMNSNLIYSSEPDFKLA